MASSVHAVLSGDGKRRIIGNLAIGVVVGEACSSRVVVRAVSIGSLLLQLGGVVALDQVCMAVTLPLCVAVV